MSGIIVKAPASARTAYSVVPDPDDPVILQLDSHLTRIVEISATGFVCAPESVKPGRRYPFSLNLPTSRLSIRGYVDVLPETGDDAQMEGRFVDLSVEEQDLLHHYVLMRQKTVLRAMRAGVDDIG